MKNLIFLLLLISQVVYSRRDVQQSQHTIQSSFLLGDIYEELTQLRQHLDQQKLFEALEIFKSQTQDSIIYQEENITLMQEFYKELQLIFSDKSQKDSLLRGQIGNFVKTTLEEFQSDLSDMIFSKVELHFMIQQEKMAERDIKEADKVQLKYSTQIQELQEKTDDLKIHIENIEKVLVSKNKEDGYRFIEVLESQISIGLFKVGNDMIGIRELQIFMREVDIIYKDPTFDQSKYSKFKMIQQLISLVLSVAYEIRLIQLQKIQDLTIEQAEHLELLVKSQDTHIKAMQFNKDQLNNLKGAINIQRRFQLQQVERIELESQNFSQSVLSDITQHQQNQNNILKQYQNKQNQFKHIQQDLLTKNDKVNFN